MEQNKDNGFEVTITDEEKEKLKLTPEQQAIFDAKIKEASRKAAERMERRVSERADFNYD